MSVDLTTGVHVKSLRDGGVISTMAQAAHLITRRLPKARQEKPVWQHAAELTRFLLAWDQAHGVADNFSRK